MRDIFRAARHLLRFRSIQQKLGVYAFILSLLAVASVSFFSYQVARNQVRRDREQLMEVQARQISENLVGELNDVAEDLRLWRNIGYIRISLRERQNEQANAFFDDLVYQRKKYDLLLTIDLNGRICAINSIGESLIGESYHALLGDLSQSWLQDTVGSDSLQLVGWRRLPAVNALYDREYKIESAEEVHQIALAVAVQDEETEEDLGVIAAILNWSHFQSILDSAATRFDYLGLTTGYAFLFANDADTIIGHKYRNEYGNSITGKYQLYGLHEKAKTDPSGTYPYEWIEGRKIAALARVNPPELQSQIDWRLGVGINNDDIFAPVEKLKMWFYLISLMIAVSVAGISILFGRAVSVSLQEFTQLARDASRGRFIISAKARSHDELGNLAEAFNEMLVNFRTQLPFATIPNPYVVGTPIRTSHMFYGRQEDLDWIGDRLEHAGNIMILLFGARRVGKTSLLHQILGERASAKVLPFFFDTQQLIPELAQDSDFYHVLTRDLLSQIPDKLPGSRAPIIAGERFTPQTFRNLLKFLHDAEPAKQPVLLFDELDNLEYKLVRGSLSSDVFLFLAGLLDSNLRVSFVVTGSDQLEAKRIPDWNILVPKTISRRIGLLAPKDALRLIEQPAHGYFIYNEGIPNRILRMTAGHPYYTQVICQTQIDFLNQNREFAVGKEQLAKVVRTVLDNPPPPLNHVWESFALLEKIAVATAAHVIDNEKDYVGREEILTAIPDDLRSLSVDQANLLSALENLIREDWMERSEEGAFRFRIDLLRLWIRREHTVWHLADELQPDSRQ